MRRSFLFLLVMALLVAGCSSQTRGDVLGWLRGSGREAASEGARIALTAAAEAASTGAPIARTLVAEGVPLAGTLSAEMLSTGAPIAGTAIAGGVNALGTRVADQPNYRCPDVLYTVDTNLNETVDISGAQLAAAIATTIPGSPLTGLGQTFVDAGRASGVNAFFLAALSAWETNWGANEDATARNNMFGYGSLSFDSPQDSIARLVPAIKADYLTAGGRFDNGPTLSGMAPNYAAGSDGWADGIATIMQLLRQNTPCPQ